MSFAHSPFFVAKFVTANRAFKLHTKKMEVIVMKKIFSLLVCVLMLYSAFAVPSFAASDREMHWYCVRRQGGKQRLHARRKERLQKGIRAREESPILAPGQKLGQKVGEATHTA